MRTLTLGVLALVTLPAFGQQPDGAKALNDLVGNYTLTRLSVAGKDLPKPEKERETFRIVTAANKKAGLNGTLIAVSTDGKMDDPVNFVLRVGVEPKEIDFTEPNRQGGPHLIGIFKVEGKTLTICFTESDKAADRPKDFTGTGDKIGVMVLEKQADKQPEPKKDPKK